MDLSEQSKNWVTHQGHLHEASSCSWQRVRPVPTDAGFYRISDGDDWLRPRRNGSQDG